MKKEIYNDSEYNGIWNFEALSNIVDKKLPNHQLLQVIYSRYKNKKLKISCNIYCKKSKKTTQITHVFLLKKTTERCFFCPTNTKEDKMIEYQIKINNIDNNYTLLDFIRTPAKTIKYLLQCKDLSHPPKWVFATSFLSKNSRCKLCDGTAFWTRAEIQKWLNLNTNSYKLIDFVKKNVLTCLIQCNNLKHKPLWYRWSYFIKTNQKCKTCLYETKFTIDKIQKIVDEKLNNYKVLNIEVIDHITKILLQCPNNHHPYYVCLTDIVKQCGCSKCNYEKAMLSDETNMESKKRCKYLGFKFLNIEKNSTHRCRYLVTYKDKYGYKYKIRYSSLFSNKNHSKSKWQGNPYIIDNIVLWCKLNREEYEVISNECKDTKRDKIIFKYNGHLLKDGVSPLFESTFEGFKNQKNAHPYISCSKSEKMVYDFLTNNNIMFFREYVFEYFKMNFNRPYRFDFYVPHINTVIECDGEQHEEPIPFFGGETAFEKLKERDVIKNNFCKDNNIKLLRINYKKFKNKEYYNILEKNIL